MTKGTPMDASLDELVSINLTLPRAVLDLLLDAALRRGMPLEQLVAEGLAAAICGCGTKHACVTLCDE